MSEAVSSKQSNAGKRWLDIAGRIAVAIIMVIAVIGLIVSLSGLVGVWVARASARTAVNDVTSVSTHALQTVNNGLGRANDQVQRARQTITQVNDEAMKLGERVQANSPLVTRLDKLVGTDLASRIENVRTTAFAIHDAVISFNSALVAVNRLPGITVPTLSDQLSGVSQRAEEAQAAVQDLRTTLADLKAGVVTKAVEAVTTRTARIDAALAQVQAIVNKYQATATRAQQRLTSASNAILLLLDISAVSLTILLVIFAMGMVLLIYVCWQYVRTGRFPNLRVVKTS